MEKKINYKEIFEDVVIIAFIAVIAASFILPAKIDDLDEIWNYNFARNIADGLVPYRDFNMVPTPLLSMICGLILKITANELIVMRTLAVAMMSAIFFMVYIILKKITTKSIALFFTTIFVLGYRQYFRIDYNFAVLLTSLILVYIELKMSEKYPKYKFMPNFLIRDNCRNCNFV